VRPESLLRFYPRAWRERYGEEFLATVGHDSLGVHQTVDVISAAIDAWLSADVRRATMASNISPNEGGPTMLRSTVCARTQPRYTKRDALIGSGVMLAATFVFMLVGIAARRAGWPESGKVLIALAYPASITLSMPFWLMKGQPWKAQLVIVGGALVLLTAIGFLSVLI
jgi:hypothetical protein